MGIFWLSRRLPAPNLRVMDAEAEGLLRKMAQAHGVPGFESEVRDLFRSELAGAGEFRCDRSGSILCETGGEGPSVLLAAHMDEVGFRVQSINAAGFLQLVPVGGWWSHTLLSQRVVVKTAAGEKVTGVIASKPPHFLSEAERKQVMSLDQMFVDIGALSREEVLAWGVNLGDPVAPLGEFEVLRGGNRYLSKAFDNRAGMAAVVLAGNRLVQGTRPNALTLGATAQEEVGLRGAQTLSSLVTPDVAVLMEGTPADDVPGFDQDTAQAKLGRGVQIRLHDPSAIMNPKLAALAIKVAEEKGISHQVAVRTSGGTDAGRIHLQGQGVPCIVLGVPARYIHSHGSVIEAGDFAAAIDLAEALVRALDAETVRGLTDFLS